MPQCQNGCYGSDINECCDHECSGGCSGPGSANCTVGSYFSIQNFKTNVLTLTVLFINTINTNGLFSLNVINILAGSFRFL